MANAFKVDDATIYANVVDALSANLNVSTNVKVYGANDELMERSGDTINRPVPLLTRPVDRIVGTSLATRDITQLTVPAVLDISKSVPLTLNYKETRDAFRWEEMQRAAGQQLAAFIDTQVRNKIAAEGALCEAFSGASSGANGGYGSIAAMEARMAELGLEDHERCMAFNSADYNGLAKDIANTLPSISSGKAENAYERSYVGMVAGFDTFKLGVSNRIQATTGSCTLDTTGPNVNFTPAANQDNRTQTATFGTVSNVNVGDRFTVAGVETVNGVDKTPSGRLQTFVVTAVAGNDLTFSPPIIGATGSPTNAQEDYKNCEITATSATAAVTFLNQTTTSANYVWTKDSIELMAGRYNVPTDQGPNVKKGTTDQGIEVVMMKSAGADTYTSVYYFDIFFGVNMLAPEKAGVTLYNQP